MDEKERTPFAERLIKAREHAKLSQPQLAKAVGMAQSTLAGLEVNGTGSRKTTQIAKRCGVRAEWLAADDGPMLPPKVVMQRPEVQEIAAAFAKLTDEQIKWAMLTIRAALQVAPDVAVQQEEAANIESSSPQRRVV